MGKQMFKIILAMSALVVSANAFSEAQLRRCSQTHEAEAYVRRADGSFVQMSQLVCD